MSRAACSAIFTFPSTPLADRVASLDWVSPARSRVRRRGNFPGGGQVTLEITEVLDTGKVAYPPNQPVIAMPLDTPTGRFLLEIRLSRRAV